MQATLQVCLLKDAKNTTALENGKRNHERPQDDSRESFKTRQILDIYKMQTHKRRKQGGGWVKSSRA